MSDDQSATEPTYHGRDARTAQQALAGAGVLYIVFWLNWRYPVLRFAAAWAKTLAFVVGMLIPCAMSLAAFRLGTKAARWTTFGDDSARSIARARCVPVGSVVV